MLPGKLTAMIRGKWGLNTLLPDHNYSDAKNRKVIDDRGALRWWGLTDGRCRQRMESTYASSGAHESRPRARRQMTQAAKHESRTSRITAWPTQLHEDTAYGAVKDAEKEGANLVYRKDFRSLNEKEIERIRDRRLRDLVKAHVETEKAAGKDLKSALQIFRRPSRYRRPAERHPACPAVEAGKARIPARGARQGRPALQILQRRRRTPSLKSSRAPDGRMARRSQSPIFQANQPKWGSRVRVSRSLPTRSLVMRVFKGDLIALDQEVRRE